MNLLIKYVYPQGPAVLCIVFLNDVCVVYTISCVTTVFWQWAGKVHSLHAVLIIQCTCFLGTLHSYNPVCMFVAIGAVLLLEHWELHI